MRRIMILLLALGTMLVLAAAPALAIVHATTPITCTSAVAASGGQAGGVAAAGAVSGSPAPGPPMPAQGLAHAAVC